MDLPPVSAAILQATGRDARRRKQYIYHTDWIAERDSNKFSALARFARVLPRIRRAVRRDLDAADTVQAARAGGRRAPAGPRVHPRGQ